MKEQWLNWRKLVIDDTDLSFGAKAIALYLNTFMNDQMDCAWPGQERIAGEMGASVRTVRRHLNELEEAGWVTTERRFHSSSVYHASIPRRVKVAFAAESQPDKFDSQMAKSDVLLNENGESTGQICRVNRPNCPPNKQENKQKKRESAKRTKRKMTPPTLEEVRAYQREKGLKVNPDRFWSYFDAGDWHDARGQLVRNWKQKMLTWDSHGKDEPQEQRVVCK